jgi:hypothetical protein
MIYNLASMVNMHCFLFGGVSFLENLFYSPGVALMVLVASLTGLTWFFFLLTVCIFDVSTSSRNFVVAEAMCN